MDDARTDLRTTLDEQAMVATVEITRPPNNFMDTPLIAALADELERLDALAGCRAVVLCSQGKHFCAGRNFGQDRAEGDTAEALYGQALRLLDGGTPIVAAVQGAAVGGGLGLAMVADFRIATPSSRFLANFTRLGFHPGFGLSVTLPPVIGQQRTLELLYTGRSVRGEQAAEMGLCDRLAADDTLREDAVAFAAQIAAAAPLAVASVRATLRGHLREQLRAAMAHEEAEQVRLRQTEDFREGTAASRERREPQFLGR